MWSVGGAVKKTETPERHKSTPEHGTAPIEGVTGAARAYTIQLVSFRFFPSLSLFSLGFHSRWNFALMQRTCCSVQVHLSTYT